MRYFVAYIYKLVAILNQNHTKMTEIELQNIIRNKELPKDELDDF
jgi:helix-turn-helix protein